MSNKRYILTRRDNILIFDTLEEVDAYTLQCVKKGDNSIRLFVEYFEPLFRCELCIKGK